jgi:hypothetical protein
MHTKNGNSENTTHKHLTLVSNRESVQTGNTNSTSSLHQQVVASGSSLREIATDERTQLDKLSQRGAALDSAIHALQHLDKAGITESVTLRNALEGVDNAVGHIKENEPEAAVKQLQSALLYLQTVPTKTHPLKSASRLLRETLDELIKAANNQIGGDHEHAFVALHAAENFQIEACRRVVDCYIASSPSN